VTSLSSSCVVYTVIWSRRLGCDSGAGAATRVSKLRDGVTSTIRWWDHHVRDPARSNPDHHDRTRAVR